MPADNSFTPGPWSFAPAVPGAKRSFYISGNHDAHNREVDIGTVQGGYYSCEANAALIAAAPDLYWAAHDMEAALTAIQSILAEWIVPDSGISDHEVLNRILNITDHRDVLMKQKAAEAALAKAAPPHRKNTED